LNGKRAKEEHMTGSNYSRTWRKKRKPEKRYGRGSRKTMKKREYKGEQQEDSLLIDADISSYLSVSHDRVSREGSVGIATGLEAISSKGRSSSPGRVRIFLLSTSSKPVLGAYPAFYPKGTGGFFPWGKAAGA
jgi:hypothetical protein